MNNDKAQKMRWFFRLLSAAGGVLLLLMLFGCQQEATPEPTPTVTPTPTATPLPPEAPLPAHILARGYLVVGMRYDLPPFGYVTAEGDVAGFDVDLGRELARRWLGDPQAVRFRQVRSDTAADHVAAGDVDLTLTALLHTQDVEHLVDFGPPLFVEGQALLVRAADAASIGAPTDLGARPVAVVEGAEAEEALWSALPYTPTLVTYPDFEQATAALARGEVDAVADMRRRLVRGMTTTPGTAIVAQYSHAVFAPAYAQDQPGLADLVDLTFQALFEDGTFDALYARWFPGDSPPQREIWPGSATLSLEQAASIAPAPDIVASIQSRGRLRVGLVSRPPFAYLDETGTPAGYEVRLVQLMAGRWLGDETAVDFLPLSQADGLRMVGSGEVDMLIGGIAHTRPAALAVDFSLTTYVGGDGLLVLSGAAPAGLAGLEGQTVAALVGSESANTLRRLAQEAGVNVTIVPRDTAEGAVASLLAGEVVAVVGERADLLGVAYATPGVDFTAERLTVTPLALALPPGRSNWRDLVDLTLQAMRYDGTLAAVYGYWFDDEPPAWYPWPGEPLQPLRIYGP